MHEKDFDRWNIIKKQTDFKQKGRFYREGQIWWCHIGLNIGNEQNGDLNNFKRPILIIKALSNKTFFALPLTTSLENNKYRIDIGIVSGKKAKVIVSQMRVLDTKRLIQYVCFLEKKLFQSIKKSVKNIF